MRTCTKHDSIVVVYDEYKDEDCPLCESNKVRDYLLTKIGEEVAQGSDRPRPVLNDAKPTPTPSAEDVVKVRS